MTDCAICGSRGTKVTAIVCQDCKEAVLLMKDIMSNLVADGGFTPEEIPFLLCDVLRAAVDATTQPRHA